MVGNRRGDDDTETLDVEETTCPPAIQVEQAIDELEPGDVLQVETTDSERSDEVADWATETGGVHLVEQEERRVGDHTVYINYVRAVHETRRNQD